MEEDWLSKCVIDPSKRKVYLYSEGGDKKTIDCDTVQEFMNVLRFVRATASEDANLQSEKFWRESRSMLC